MATLKIKRGTRAQLDAAAAASGLVQGEPYLITDEDRLAVGLSATTYEEFVKLADPISDLVETGTAKILTGAERTLLGNQSGTNTGDEPAASTTVQGTVELATIAEVDTGTDTTRAVTPDALEGSALQTKVDGIAAGATADAFTATNSNASAITIGQAVYVDGSGSVDLAMANAAATDRTIGLVGDASIAVAGSGNVQPRGILTSADWTSVIGSTNLTAGADYFLSPTTAGRLTATAPSTVGQFVVYVGHAISTTVMLLGIERPVGL